jgi:hypothetical protein
MAKVSSQKEWINKFEEEEVSDLPNLNILDEYEKICKRFPKNWWGISPLIISYWGVLPAHT